MTLMSQGLLADIYHQWGPRHYEKAWQLYQQASQAAELTLGPTHPQTLQLLRAWRGLAKKIPGQEKLVAELTSKIDSQTQLSQGHANLETAASFNRLGVLHYQRGRYGKAEPLLGQTLAIRRRILGADHPDTALSLNNLAGLYYYQKRYREAEPLLLQALAIRERVLGEEHPDTVSTRQSLARLRQAMGSDE